MARPLRIEFPDAFYHVTCRGNQKRHIFIGDDDRHRFLLLLSDSLSIYQITLMAYVLMDNHFHLLVQTPRANLGEFMRRFNICYTGWFNYRHGTCGHLYQGRYKAIIIDADSYLLELSRYIHLNPARGDRSRKTAVAQRWRILKDYRWSSLHGYLNKRHAAKFIEYDLILEMIGGRRAYRQFISDGLQRKVVSPFEKVRYQTMLGDDDFVEDMKDRLLEKGSPREQPVYRELMSEKFAPRRVLYHVARVMNADLNVLRKRERGGILRGIAAEMLYRYSGLKLADIGHLLGDIDYCAVYQLRQRLKDVLANNEELKLKFNEIERRIQENVEC
jgi:putative transposase